jgi:signal transduction histidine kinase
MSAGSGSVGAAPGPSSGEVVPGVRVVSRTWPPGAWLIPAAITVGFATLVIVPTTVHSGTTHAGASELGLIADAAAGWTLIAAGVASLQQRSITRVGTRALLAGMTWFAADWAGWVAGPPIARSIAELLGPFFLAIVIDIAVRARRPEPTWSTGASRLAYATTAVLVAATAIVRDARLDPACWQRCGDIGLALLPNAAVARALGAAAIAAGTFGGGLLVANAAPLLRRRPHPAMDAVVLACAVVGASQALLWLVRWSWPPENPFDPTFAALFQMTAWSAVVLGLALLAAVVGIRRARIALEGLAASLVERPVPRTLQQTLIELTGDGSLRVAYPRDDDLTPVDADGTPLETPLGGPARALIAITRGARIVAFVDHDPAMISDASLRDELGAAGRLAVENERLRAEVRAHARELRTSRREIVATMDQARQQLERDLHDGAQQRLIALGYDLALAEAAARVQAPAAADEVGRIRAQTRAALEELRELAHGIFPAVLDESGVGPALRTLAERSSIPVELDALPAGRQGAMAESTAYVLVDEVITAATRHGATFAQVEIRADDGALTAIVRHDAGTTTFDTVPVADRVGAAGGSLAIERAGVLTEVRAWIPVAR